MFRCHVSVRCCVSSLRESTLFCIVVTLVRAVVFCRYVSPHDCPLLLG